MNEQWRCPVCETMNDSDVCIVCGAPKNLPSDNDHINSEEHTANRNTAFSDGEHIGVNGEHAASDSEQIVSDKGFDGTDVFSGEGTEDLGYVKEKKDKKKTGIVWGFVAAAILICAVYILFLHPANAYENNFSLLRASMMDTSEKVDYYIQKANNAADAGQLYEADFYLRDRALSFSGNDSEVWEQLISLDRRRGELEQMDKDIATVMERVGRPDDALAEMISVRAVERIELAAEELIDDIYSSTEDEVPEDIKVQFRDMITLDVSYTEYLTNEDDDTVYIDAVSTAKRDAYLSAYEALMVMPEAYVDYGYEILEEAVGTFPDDETFVANIIDLYVAKADEAFSEGDFDKAHEVCENLKVLDEELYHSTKISIYQVQFDDAMAAYDTDEAYDICNLAAEHDSSTASSWQAEVDAYIDKVEFMAKAAKYMSNSDYDSLHKLMVNDSSYKSSTIYYIDGKVVDDINSGKGYIYSSSGMYYGNISNNQRSGSGKQYIHFSNKYKIFEGQWSANYPNGQGTYIWWTDGDVKATVKGNFTNGYENGTMTISWYSSGSWTATYKADMGTLTNASKEGDVYKYAYVTYGNSSAWWTSSSIEGYGVSKFMK